MNIVLIEDDAQKAERVTDALVAFGACDVSLFRSYQSGLKRILAGAPVDLIILDMSLPTFDPRPEVRPGRPRPLGGYDLMRKLKRKERVSPVLILSALENFGSIAKPITFAELSKQCESEFPSLFKGAIYYSQSRSGWKTELEKVLRGIDEQNSID